MSKDIKKALERCMDKKCVGCPNNEELGSGDIVCRGRLLPEVLEYVADLETKLAESERKNFELLTKLNLKEYAPAFCTLADRDCEALGQIEELKNQLEEKDADIIALDTDNYSFKQQIDNLRQQLKSQPAEIVEKIRKEVEKEKYENDLAWLGFKKLDRILDTILKEYQK